MDDLDRWRTGLAVLADQWWFRWDERFTDYDTAPAIAVPGESDVHPATTVPTCPGGADPVFDGFCRKA